MDIATPTWVRHAVFYQIYPDRFCKSPRTQHQRGIRFTPWGSSAQSNTFQGGDKSALRLAVLLQMTMPGAPCVYCGDKVGMSSWGDPHCRAAFPWHQGPTWDRDLSGFYRQAIAMRHQNPVLRTGSFMTLYASGEIVAFARALEGQEALIVLNTGTAPAMCPLDITSVTARRFAQVWPHGGSQTYQATEGLLEVILAPRDALVLVSKTSR